MLPGHVMPKDSRPRTPVPEFMQLVYMVTELGGDKGGGGDSGGGVGGGGDVGDGGAGGERGGDKACGEGGGTGGGDGDGASAETEGAHKKKTTARGERRQLAARHTDAPASAHTDAPKVSRTDDMRRAMTIRAAPTAMPAWLMISPHGGEGRASCLIPAMEVLLLHAQEARMHVSPLPLARRMILPNREPHPRG